MIETSDGQIIHSSAIEREIYTFFDNLPRTGKEKNGDSVYQRIVDAPQSVFNAALTQAGKALFSDRRKLHDERYRGKDNRYNYDLLLSIADEYIYLCNLFNKEPSYYGYCLLINTPIDSFNALYPSCDALDDSVTTARKQLAKKLSTARENALAAALFTGRKNPVGLLASLNHFYNWAAPGMPKDDGDGASRLSADDLPRLCPPTIDTTTGDDDDGKRETP